MFPAGSSHVHTRMVTLPGGMHLRVAESGSATGRPLLLLHGWGASLYMWRDWFVPLAAAGRRVIAVDLPGHGLSDKPDDDSVYRLPALVQVVRDLIAAEGLAPVDVVAQSMAGTITVELIVTAPAFVRRAVLVNAACFGRVRLERLFPVARSSLADRILPRLVRRWIVARTHRLQYHDPSTIAERDEDEYWAPSQFPSFTRAMRRLIHVFQWQRSRPADLADGLRAADVPLLALLGERDGLVRDAIPYVAALQEAGAGISSMVIENGAHAMNEEWPEMISRHTLDFLE
ncbi:MAG: hypothetical protein JWM95_4360 [Gemmatimonadetes bacterium]|nr:hypothetical protein [Gemmatimonadota bacterium]